eukprot:3810588-Rhodomonas_salina.1
MHTRERVKSWDFTLCTHWPAMCWCWCIRRGTETEERNELVPVTHLVTARGAAAHVNYFTCPSPLT